MCLFLGVFGCYGQWKQYSNKEYKFSILYPRSWEYNEDIYNTVFLAKEPIKSPTDKFQSNINVVVTQLPQPLSLEAYYDLNKEELTRRLSPITNILEGDVYSGMLAGKWFSFEGMMKDIVLRVTVAVWVKDKTVYTVTCSAPVKDYPKYEATFFKIMRSLRAK